jgi:uncharacterized membrane protein HdeD (DUF308 family)
MPPNPSRHRLHFRNSPAGYSRNCDHHIRWVAPGFQRGRAHLVYGWQTRETGGLIWELLVGILYLVAGIYLLVNPLMGVFSLTLALAIYLFVEAVLEFILAVRLHPMPGSGCSSGMPLLP